MNFRTVIFSATAIVFLTFVPSADAAEIFASPSVGSFSVGETFSVSINIASDGKPINAVSGTLIFPKDKMSVLSVSKSGSVINFWPEDPSFLSSSGEVSFEGIILNPGFLGQSGKIATVFFRAEKEGRADLVFGSGSILANDGYGTEILTGKKGSSFSLSPIQISRKVLPEVSAKKAPDSAIPIPDLTSSTHPISGGWYSADSVSVSWDLPEEVSAVRLSFDKNPEGSPSVSYHPAIADKEIFGVADGIWYFHADFGIGESYGRSAHHEVRIDTSPPERVVVSELPRSDKADPRVIFSISGKDKLSGIARYEVKIDKEKRESWADGDREFYVVPPLSPGNHELIVTAFDKAGNSSSREIVFEITPLPTPILNVRRDSGNSAVVRGTAVPGTTVALRIKKDDEDARIHNMPVSADGTFVFFYRNDSLAGTYAFSASAHDYRGARSLSTEEKSVYLKSRFSLFGSDLSPISLYAVPMVFIIIAFAAIASIAVRSRYANRSRKKRRRTVKFIGLARKPYVD